MKATRIFGILKAIAFVTVVFFSISCNPKDEPVVLSPVITIGEVENVMLTSVTLVATVVPNSDNVPVFFSYKENLGSNWIIIDAATTFSGSTSSKVSVNVTGLQPGIKYDFKANAGSVVSGINTFTTTSLPVIKIGIAQNVKISTAKLTATIIPFSNNVPISFEYQTAGSTWLSKLIPGNFSGKDSIKVTLDLSDLQANTVYKFRLKAGDQTSGESSFRTYAVADYDGNYYHTVTIGNQTWLQENFKGIHFANGDAIANVTNQSAWNNQTAGAYCFYDNDSENGKIYGGLYNWYVADDSRGLIIGYKTPSNDDWDILINYLGGYNLAGSKLKEAGASHWGSYNTDATNSSGFTGLPGGERTADFFTTISGVGYFLSKTIYPDPSCAYSYYLTQIGTNVGRGGNYKFTGQSVRLIKN